MPPKYKEKKVAEKETAKQLAAQETAKKLHRQEVEQRVARALAQRKIDEELAKQQEAEESLKQAAAEEQTDLNHPLDETNFMTEDLAIAIVNATTEQQEAYDMGFEIITADGNENINLVGEVNAGTSSLGNYMMGFMGFGK